MCLPRTSTISLDASTRRQVSLNDRVSIVGGSADYRARGGKVIEILDCSLVSVEVEADRYGRCTVVAFRSAELLVRTP
jgi:hypothetical protein